MYPIRKGHIMPTIKEQINTLKVRVFDIIVQQSSLQTQFNSLDKVKNDYLKELNELQQKLLSEPQQTQQLDGHNA